MFTKASNTALPASGLFFRVAGLRLFSIRNKQGRNSFFVTPLNFFLLHAISQCNKKRY